MTTSLNKSIADLSIESGFFHNNTCFWIRHQTKQKAKRQLLRSNGEKFLTIFALPGLRGSNLTLFSMFYFKNTTVMGGGGIMPPPNFVVSSSVMIRFGVLIEFDKFSRK